MEWIRKEYEVKNKSIIGIMDTSKYEGFFVLKTLVGWNKNLTLILGVILLPPVGYPLITQKQ